MAEFYDELFDVNVPNDIDVDIIFPDGSKEEMYLNKLPKVGDLLRGHIVEKLILNNTKTDNECEARIELKRKELKK